MNPSLGLYDLQNDKRILPPRTLSAMNDYRETILTTEMKPLIQSLKKNDRKEQKEQKDQKNVNKNDSDLFKDPEYHE